MSPGSVYGTTLWMRHRLSLSATGNVHVNVHMQKI